MKQWYETFFENYGRKYDDEAFTRGTTGECDFIEKEINHDKSLNILDIGCGTGRHAIELSRRGYRVTGVDLSESLLARAEEKAVSLNLKIDFRKADARKLPFKTEFDLALMLCEAAFPLMETDEMNYEILKKASSALKEKGKLVMTTLNGLFPLFHSLKNFHLEIEERDDPPSSYKHGSFDFMTFRDRNVVTLVDDSGQEKKMECNERYYVPSEMTWLLKSAGFAKIDI